MFVDKSRCNNPVNVTGSQNGGTMVFFVMTLVAILLVTGMAVDLGNAYLTRSRLSKATDASHEIHSPPPDTWWSLDLISDYLADDTR